MTPKYISIDPQKPNFKTELHGSWYKCPQCDTPHIAEHFKYCPNCGAPILWQPLLNTYIVAGIQVRKNDTVAYFGPETYRASSKNDLVSQLKKKYPGLLRDLKIIEVNRRLPWQE